MAESGSGLGVLSGTNNVKEDTKYQKVCDIRKDSNSDRKRVQIPSTSSTYPIKRCSVDHRSTCPQAFETPSNPIQ
jgi:hypothetical protein